MGASNYSVASVDGAAFVSSCNNTTCEVKELSCGLVYNFTVVAKNSQCASPPSSPISLQTGEVSFH